MVKKESGRDAIWEKMVNIHHNYCECEDCRRALLHTERFALGRYLDQDESESHLRRASLFLLTSFHGYLLFISCLSYLFFGFFEVEGGKTLGDAKGGVRGPAPCFASHEDKRQSRADGHHPWKCLKKRKEYLKVNLRVKKIF